MSQAKEPRGRVTLMEVARAAGVSRTAASSALTRTGRVSAETAERVRRVARELNYRPNVAAQNLRRARNGAIGLVLPDDVTGLSYYMDFTFGIVEVAKENGISLVLLPSDVSSTSISVSLDGFIVIDAQDGDEHVRELFSLGLPVVSGERLDAALGTPVGTVESDHVGAMIELLDHMRANGARHPAFLAPGEDFAWGRALREGYTTWCHANGVRPRISDVSFSPAVAQAADACRRLLTDHPETDALVCGSDHTAAVVVDVAATLGRMLGEDLLVASCVDSAVVQLATPPITALDLDPREFGSHCARLFVRLLAEDERPAATVIEMSPTRLRVRASTTNARAQPTPR